MNAADPLTQFRTDKVRSLAQHQKRADGRAADAYRDISITYDVSKNADGSARVRLGQTDVIAGIKVVLGTPYPDTPNEGTFATGAEMLPIASPIFEAGPPRADAIELGRVVDRGIRESKALDFSELCIRDGELVRLVFLDIYPMNHDGNLFDAASIAGLAALTKTQLPKVEDDQIVKGEYVGKLKLRKKPLLTTVAKIGNMVVADPTFDEENAMTARLSTATTEDDMICAFQKGEKGGFTYDEVSTAIDIALARQKEIRKLL